MRLFVLIALALASCLPTENVELGEVYYELPVDSECDAGVQPDASQQSCGIWIDISMSKARARALTPGEEPDIEFRALGRVSCTDAFALSNKSYYDKSYVHPIPMWWQE